MKLPGMDDFTSIINQIWSDQTQTTVKYIDSLELQLNQKRDFMKLIQPELDSILNKAVPTMEEHIEQFYAAGKQYGFDAMEVSTFFGNSDRHALYTLKQYNFDLVKNANNDLIRGIRQIIWQGTARGDSIPEISKALQKLPMEPLQTVNGRWISPKVRSTMIARTESMRAMNQGSLLSFEQMGVEMIDIPPTGTEGKWKCDCPEIVAGSPYPIDKVPYLPRHTHCYDKETEVYTSNGWKLFKDVDKKDLILTIDPVTHEIEFVNFVNKIGYKYSGKMVHLYNKWFDMEVTPDHQMYIGIRPDPKNRKLIKWIFREAQNLPGEYKILRTAEWEGKEDKIVIESHEPNKPGRRNHGKLEFNPEDFAYFMGWWLSEGHIEHNTPYKVGISQWDKEELNIIYSNVKKMLDNCCKVFLCDSYIAFHHKEMYEYLKQFGKAHEKFIPREIKELSPKYIEIFLEAYLKGDGSCREHKNRYKNFISKEKVFHTSSKRMADDLSELILKCGGYPSIYIGKTEGKEVKFKNGNYKINHNMYRISWNRSKMTHSNSLKKEMVQYDGMVYCLELEKHHILWVKRNNKTAFSGNCTHVYAPASEPVEGVMDPDTYINLVLKGRTPVIDLT